MRLRHRLLLPAALLLTAIALPASASSASVKTRLDARGVKYEVDGDGDYKVTYSVLENTDAAMKADSYFANWIQNAPKIFPGFQPVRADGRVQGLTGATFSGDMDLKTTGATTFFEKAGIPAYPVVTGTATDIMTDPLGGPKRAPWS